MRLLKCLLMLALLCSIASAQQFGLTYHQVQVVDETGERITGISSVEIYLPDTTTNATIYQDPAKARAITVPLTTTSTNTTLSNGFFSWWGPDGWDFSITDGTNIATNAGHRTRTGSDGRIVFPSYLTSISSTTYADNETITLGTSSDWVANAGATANRLTWTPAIADDAEFWIGTTSYPADLLLYGATSGYDVRWDASQDRLEFADNATITVGTGADWTVAHNGSTTTVAGAFSCSGIPTFTTDVLFDGTYDIAYDDSRYQLLFQDSAVLGLGGAADAAGDITFVYDGTDLLMEAAAADDLWKIGATTNFDIGIYGDTATDLMYWDTSAELVYLDGFDLRFNDGDFLKFGDDSDWTFDSSTATILDIVPLTTDETSAIYVGADTAGADLKLFGATTAEYVLWDASSDTLSCNAGNILWTMTDAEANQWKVDATGTVAGYAAVIETTDGGIQLNADGAANGDISIDAADAITLITGSASGVLLSSNAKTFRYVTCPISYVSATEIRCGGNGTANLCAGLTAGADETGAVEGYATVDDAADFLRFTVQPPFTWVDTGTATDLVLAFDILEVAAEECNIDVRVFEDANATSPIFTDTIVVANGASRAWCPLVTLATGIGADADVDAGDHFIVEVTGTADADDFKIYGMRMKYRVGLQANQ